MLFIGSILLFDPGILTGLIGILIGLAILLCQKLSLRKEAGLMTGVRR
jgi:hypothetical protein